jgi:hypothetical protein
MTILRPHLEIKVHNLIRLFVRPSVRLLFERKKAENLKKTDSLVMRTQYYG